MATGYKLGREHYRGCTYVLGIAPKTKGATYISPTHPLKNALSTYYLLADIAEAQHYTYMVTAEQNGAHTQIHGACMHGSAFLICTNIITYPLQLEAGQWTCSCVAYHTKWNQTHKDSFPR